jgi:hypothetical protein
VGFGYCIFGGITTLFIVFNLMYKLIRPDCAVPNVGVGV